MKFITEDNPQIKNYRSRVRELIEHAFEGIQLEINDNKDGTFYIIAHNLREIAEQDFFVNLGGFDYCVGHIKGILFTLEHQL
jgi:hypothetical protein